MIRKDSAKMHKIFVRKKLDRNCYSILIMLKNVNKKL